MPPTPGLLAVGAPPAPCAPAKTSGARQGALSVGAGGHVQINGARLFSSSFGGACTNTKHRLTAPWRSDVASSAREVSPTSGCLLRCAVIQNFCFSQREGEEGEEEEGEGGPPQAGAWIPRE